jgi:hypothetical protein
VHILFELQGFNRKQAKHAQIWASAVYRHTAKGTKVLLSLTCRHGSAVLDQMVILLGLNTRQTQMNTAKLAHGKEWGPALVHAWSGSQSQTHGRDGAHGR